MEERKSSSSDPAPIQLGDLFLSVSDVFKAYTPYFINHPTAEAVVRDLMETNKIFAEFLNVRDRARARKLHPFYAPPSHAPLLSPLPSRLNNSTILALEG
jgi:hypothetical protein